MYIMLTNRCNMTCAHCGMNCKKTGKDMSKKVWKASLEIALGYSEHVTLGGGEPTLHPDFKEILFDAISKFDSVWMATNGSQTEISLALAKLAKKGIMGVALSQDVYHDRIDPKVVEAFTENKRLYCTDSDNNDSREIRDVTGKEIKAGRCKEGEDGCICSEIQIRPDGKIYGCGCKDAPCLGTVFNPQIPDFWQSGECSKSQTDEDDHS